MDSPWSMTIVIGGDSFASMKATALQVLKEIEKAETFKQLPTDAAWTAGFNGAGPSGNYSVTTKSPVEDRIKHLREEADALERDLQKPDRQ